MDGRRAGLDDGRARGAAPDRGGDPARSGRSRAGHRARSRELPRASLPPERPARVPPARRRGRRLVTVEQQRIAEALGRHGRGAVLLVTPRNVTYSSGFEVPLPGGFGTDVVDWLPTCCVVRSDGTGVLVVPEDTPAESWLEVVTFESLRHFEPSDPR